ncbi:hypothetical protein KY290_031911 [Solanum tuberosum]|uniref:Kelch repeat-containing F-box family protein n=1 Tax=Solanum tuberosum TaxID=4113 RepID=A0ABQ7UBP0_SOLTU|nr:hypothetical protein KY289_031323 [Solanum tuberosum]KAH0743918.1 hypothetical protein KY290_031911 [Solanum tuberosum]
MSNWISCYHPSTNSWHRLTTIPGLLENQVIKSFAMVSLGETIYVIGGRHYYKAFGDGPDDNYVQEMRLGGVRSSVLKYDTRVDTWSTCARGQTTLDSAEGTSFAEIYDPVKDEWESLPNMSTLRYKSVAVAWQGNVD